eukprot:8708471-Pyramimonas_sp.AAC.1
MLQLRSRGSVTCFSRQCASLPVKCPRDARCQEGSGRRAWIHCCATCNVLLLLSITEWCARALMTS